MAHAAVLYRDYNLPWTTGAEQEQRFRRLVIRCVAGCLAAALLLSVLPTPAPDPAAIEEIPPRFARLVLEERPEPPPPPPVQRDEPEPAAEPEPVVEERVEEPAPEPVVETPPEPAPAERTEQARERARVAGVLPFAEQLSALRDNDTLERLDAPQAAAGAASDAAAAVPERSLITSRAGQSSGGINTAALSRDTGGGGLAGRETTQVESRIADAASAAATASAAGSDSRPSRSREEIERVFDRNKGAIYTIYNRALRSNPTLEGKLVLRLTIAPDGSVTACEVVSSELGDPDLEQKLVQRVMLFRFEPKDVEPITTTKPIDFFPA